MDFSNRSVQPQPAAPSTHTAAPVSSGGSARKNSKADQSKLFRIAQAILFFAVVVVLIGLLVFLVFGGNSDSESKYIDTNRLQAVFLNTGQVYFGNIKTLNDKYVVLENIYYLQTSSGSSSSSTSSSNTSVSLVKLGCELHAPYDQMVINRDQVTFWENLQPSGQVAKAVATFEKDNPNGQKCSDQSTAGTSGQSTVQGTSSSNSGTTSTTSGTSTSNP